MSTPEARARDLIDRQLQAAGWVLQHRDEFNRKASRGVAVREFPLPAGEADYLLFVEGKAAGAVEAKKTGTTLSGFAEQSEKYLTQLPERLARRAPSPLRSVLNVLAFGAAGNPRSMAQGDREECVRMVVRGASWFADGGTGRSSAY